MSKQKTVDWVVLSSAGEGKARTGLPVKAVSMEDCCPRSRKDLVREILGRINWCPGPQQRFVEQKRAFSRVRDRLTRNPACGTILQFGIGELVRQKGVQRGLNPREAACGGMAGQSVKSLHVHVVLGSSSRASRDRQGKALVGSRASGLVGKCAVDPHKAALHVDHRMLAREV